MVSYKNSDTYYKKIELLLFLLVKSLKQEKERRLKASGIKTGLIGLAIMNLLKKRGLTLVTLSQRLILAPATLVPVINHLENLSLIKREINQEDRRSHLLSLTAAGRRILRQAGALSNNLLQQELRRLPLSDQEKFYQLLNELAQAVLGPNKLKSILNLCQKK